MTTNKNYDFGEKTKESYKTKEGWAELQVVHHAKYKASREKAIELIESGKYGLEEADFWILKNSFGSGDKAKLYYTGLIISHNGCLKINDKLDEKLKFDPEFVSFYKDNGGEKVMQYINKEQKVYEFGEISPSNCNNSYPYAMVLKRLMDRVILKTSKIGFFGIYSEAESDEFKEKPEAKTPLQNLAEGLDEDMADTIFGYLSDSIQKCETLKELEDLKATKEFKQSYSKLGKIDKKQFDLIGTIGANKKAELSDDNVEDIGR